MGSAGHYKLRSILVAISWTILLVLAVPATSRAQQSEEFDQYKLRLDTFWFYSSPSGTIKGSADAVPVDFVEDLNFNTYSTFSGRVDWKFTHKNHFYVAIYPFYTTRQTTLARDITFQGQTFVAGTQVNSQLHAILAAPGYQRDIVRRKRGHLGLGVQMDLFNTTAKISEAAQAGGGGGQSVSASGHLLAPIPVAGPEFRFYLTNSPRLFIEGNLYGMYFFGYGNFVSSSGTIGLSLTRRISVNGGYQLGSRLVVTGTADRVGLTLTQRGAIAGMEFSF